MALTKEDTLHFKGVAILGMVLLHLFCRLGNLPYTPLIWIGKIPLIYYVGLFGDFCVPVYCFCSGYAHFLLQEKQGRHYAHRIPGKILRFLVNYWIVVVLFSGLGMLFDRSGTVPGSFSTFVGNMLLVGMSYNGAWWFVTTYLFLLILSPISFQIAKKLHGVLLLALSGIIYFAAYCFRFQYTVQLSNPMLNWIWQQLILFGTSQFPYLIGMVAFRYHIPDKIRGYFQTHRHTVLKWTIVIGLPLLAFIGHGIVQSVIVAPFTAVMILVSLTLAPLPKWLAAVLAFLGKHSTNIWFVHMFFYLTLFPGLVFHAKYPLLITVLMFALCIGTSYLIEMIYKPICKTIG